MLVARDRGHLNKSSRRTTDGCTRKRNNDPRWPGTPAGETLRRYWLPINFSDEVKTDEPKVVRRLAEDLLLFRDEFGRVGLTEPVCPHRGTSLEYGWIEAGGIRCCYHGWVYDVNGRCIDQPG